MSVAAPGVVDHRLSKPNKRRGRIPALLLVAGAMLPWAVIGGQNAQIAIIALGLFGAIAHLVFTHRPIPPFAMPLVLGFVTLILLQSLAGYGLTAQNYASTALIGLIVALSGLGSKIKPLLLILLIACVVLQAVEMVTGTYIFTVTTGSITLDDELFSGNTGLLRAKGIFYGPLSAAMYAALVAICYRGDPRVWLLAIASAAMAQGRLAIALLVVGGILIGSRTLKSLGRRIAGILSAIVVLAVGWSFLDPITQANYLSALDLTDRRNVARQSFWESGWDLFWNSEPIALLLGHPGETYRAFSNSSENDLIQILNDTGLAGFVLILITAIYLAASSRNRWLLLLIPASFAAATFASLAVGSALWFTLAQKPSAAYAEQFDDEDAHQAQPVLSPI